MNIWLTLVTSVVGGAIALLLNLGVKAIDNLKAAKNNALYAAIALEEWAVCCFRVTCEMGDFLETEGQLGRSHKRLPELINFRKEIDLSALEITIRGEVLSFQAKANLSNANIESDLHIHSVHVAGQHSAERGLEAVVLAAKIRKKYGLKRTADHEYEHAVSVLNREVNENKAKAAKQLTAWNDFVALQKEVTK